jgi:hypothetical protein
MVQQVEVVVTRGQHLFVLCAFFLAPFVFALGFGGIYLAQEGMHPAIVIVGAIACFACFLFALAKLPMLALIYGLVVSISATIFAFYFIYDMSDAIWASLAAIVALAVGIFVSWVAYGVFSGKQLSQYDE